MKETTQRDMVNLLPHGSGLNQQMSLRVGVLGQDDANRTTWDLDALVKQWARRILGSADGLSRAQRQILHDICRPDRSDFNRSAIARLVELAPFASTSDATFGPEAIRGIILGAISISLPTLDEAYEWEEQANARTNLAQQRYRESRDRATCEAVCEAFGEQALASRIGADVSWASLRRAS